MLRFLLGLACAAFMLAAFGCSGDDEAPSSAATTQPSTSLADDSQRLLDSLPQIPGSQRIDVQSIPYCDATSPIGYSSFEHRRTAAAMNHDEIVAFYTANLGSDWKQISRDDVVLENLPSPFPRGSTGVDTEVRFQRGDETVFLSMIPLEGSYPNLTIHSPNDYSVSADAHRIDGRCNNG